MRRTDDGKLFITPQEAIDLLEDGDQIHTFLNPTGGIMVGADHSRKEIIKSLKAHPDNIEIGGPACRAMNHAIVIATGASPQSHLFIANDKEKLDLLDPEGAKEENE